MTDENLTPMPEEPATPPAPPVPEPASAPVDFMPEAPAPEPYVPPAPEPAEPPAYVAPAPESPAPPAYAPPVPPPAPPAYAPPAPPQPGYQQPAAATSDKQKIVAGLLGILLGTFGIHKFYLGYNKEGLIMLLVSILSFGLLTWVISIIGLIEGIMYITKTDAEFESMYVTGRKAWF